MTLATGESEEVICKPDLDGSSEATFMIRSDHFAFETIDQGVHVALSRPDGGALANAGIVDLKNDVLVFDTSLNPRAAADLVSAASSRVGRPPSLAANSHWHLDHTLGNQLFSASSIFGTRETRRILLAKREQLMAELRPDVLRKEVRNLEMLVKNARSVATRSYLNSVVRVNRFLLAVAPEIRLTPPNRTFVRRLKLPGSRSAELLSFGSGHTASDAILHLPDERIIFSGDLVVVGHHPNLTSGDPEHWLKVLAALEKLHAEKIVPGHGPVASTDAVQAVSDYLSTILRLAERKGEPAIPFRFREWVDPSQFEVNLKFLRSRDAGSPAAEGP